MRGRRPTFLDGGTGMNLYYGGNGGGAGKGIGNDTFVFNASGASTPTIDLEGRDKVQLLASASPRSATSWHIRIRTAPNW